LVGEEGEEEEEDDEDDEDDAFERPRQAGLMQAAPGGWRVSQESQQMDWI
jgi:hypothetical protein